MISPYQLRPDRILQRLHHWTTPIRPWRVIAADCCAYLLCRVLLPFATRPLLTSAVGITGVASCTLRSLSESVRLQASPLLQSGTLSGWATIIITTQDLVAYFWWYLGKPTLSLGSSKLFHRRRALASKGPSLPGVLAAPAASRVLASTYVAV